MFLPGVEYGTSIDMELDPDDTVDKPTQIVLSFESR